MSAHENLEHAEHAEHASHGGNKKIALLIAVLALFLALSETLGKSAQTDGHHRQRHGQRPVGVLPGQDHPHDRARTRRPSRCRSRPTAPPIPTTKARHRQDHRRPGRRPSRAMTTTQKSNEGRKQLVRARQARRGKPRARAGALSQLRIRLGRASRSASCSPRRKSSPAWSRWDGSPALLGVAGLALTGLGLWAPHALHALIG